MKVALVGNLASIHVQNWAEALSAAGVEVDVITQDPAPAWTPPRGVRTTLLPFRGQRGYFVNRFAYRKALARIQPDLVNVHYLSGYGTLAASSRRFPLLASAWGADVYEVPDQSRVHRALVRRALLAGDAVASTSRVMVDRVREVAPEVDEVFVTPFGVDTDAFCPADEPSRTDVLTIGTVKTLDEKYGIDLLIRGFQAAQAGLEEASGRTARLVIAGGGPQRHQLEELARSLGVADAVEFLGPVAPVDVPEVLRSLDVFVAMSRLPSESFGVAVIEASACALPVVVADMGGLPEVVEAGVTGEIVPSEDHEALARHLVALAGDPERRRAMGTAGRARVLERYSRPQVRDVPSTWR